MSNSNQPNILFIQADQMTAFALGQYGNPIVKTPNIDRIARNGMVFENAYCNNPICASSRFSMMSGRLSSKIGAYDNATEFPASIPTFAHYLNDLGYQTCLSGKMHFIGPDQLHGFQERVTTDIYPSDFGWTPDWQAEGYPYSPSGISMRAVVEAGVSARSLQIDYDEEVCYQAEVKLWEYARTETRKPFFLAASFTHPHNPFTTQSEFWDLYDHDEINMPTNPGKPVEERDPWSQRYYHLIRNDEYVITDEDVRNARHAYYGMCSYIDFLIGRLLKVLDESDLTKNTIVIFTADHGEMLGERGMWYKFNPFESSVRVPLLISAPGYLKGVKEASLVSLVDLLPTFLDLGSASDSPIPIEPVDGKSLVPLLRGETKSWKNDVMIEFTAEGTIAPALILRRDAYKFVYCETDPSMLFNLEDDPHELNNLCEDPAYQALADELLEQILTRWDPITLKDKIIASQQRRLFIQKTFTGENRAPWDFQPFKDASKQFLRAGNSPAQIKGLARYPSVPPKKPDKLRRT